MTTVLLVDDHPVVREGLRGMIDAEDDLTVVGEAGSGAEAADAVKDTAANAQEDLARSSEEDKAEAAQEKQ